MCPNDYRTESGRCYRGMKTEKPTQLFIAQTGKAASAAGCERTESNEALPVLLAFKSLSQILLFGEFSDTLKTFYFP